jgi:predicted nucleic acid-binding protein
VGVVEGSAVTVVLDTDVLIDYLRGLKSAVAFVEKLSREGVVLATTAVNLFELAWGACKLGGGKLRDVQKLAGALTVLSLSEREALKAGEEMGYLESLGAPVDLRDVLIGVIARENGASLATGNAKHFKRIRGLTVIEYRRGRNAER